MRRRYQIDQQRAVQQFRQLAREENPSIQMIFPMASVLMSDLPDSGCIVAKVLRNLCSSHLLQ